MIEFILSALSFAFFIIAGVWLSRRWGIHPLVFLVLFGLYCSIAIVFFRPTSTWYLSSDADVYLAQANSVVTWIKKGFTGDLVLNSFKESWPLFIGFIYFAFGPVPTLILLINCAILSFIVLILIRIAQKLFSVTPSLEIAALFLVTPMILASGPTLMRETPFWFFATLILFASVNAFQDKWISAAVFFAIGAIGLLVMRPNLGLVVIFGFLFPIIPIVYRHVSNLYARGIAISVSWLVLLVTAPSTFKAFSWMVERVEVSRDILSSTSNTGFGSTSLATAIPTVPPTSSPTIMTPSPSAIPGYDAVNSGAKLGFPFLDQLSTFFRLGVETFPRVLFGPYFSEIRPSFSWIFMAFSTFVWLTICILAIVQMLKLKQLRSIATVHMFAVVALLIILAITLSNYGIIARFRIPAEIFLIPWAGAALFAVREKYSKRILHFRPSSRAIR